VFLGNVIRFLRLGNREAEDQLRAITRRREELSLLANSELKAVARNIGDTKSIVETFAITAVIAERMLRLRMFDVQILAALALQRGEVAEMQTGEGKTLAAVPAVIWYALRNRGVHVFTANDYLAQRDAAWMRSVYESFGLSTAHVSQNMSAERRRAAYQCDVTYATANEIGFDYLRDGLAQSARELVQRPFAFAIIDEADSILIDDARIPLVIAGGIHEDPELALLGDSVARNLQFRVHYSVDEAARNVQLTDLGVGCVERALTCGNLFTEDNLRILTAVQDALHAQRQHGSSLQRRRFDEPSPGRWHQLYFRNRRRIHQHCPCVRLAENSGNYDSTKT